MHKPDNPVDAIEAVETILQRLVPSALSENASRANESMIDGLASGHVAQPALLKTLTTRPYWLASGIAASLVASAGLVFWGQPKKQEGSNAGISTTLHPAVPVQAAAENPDQEAMVVKISRTEGEAEIRWDGEMYHLVITIPNQGETFNGPFPTNGAFESIPAAWRISVMKIKRALDQSIGGEQPSPMPPKHSVAP